MGVLVKLQNVRLSFPTLFQASDYNGDKNFKYRASFIIEPGSKNDKLIRDAIKQTADEAWKAKAPAVLKSIEHNNMKYCYTPGDLKEYDGYEGKMILRATNSARPTTVDRDKSPLSAEDGRPYGGCFVNAHVEIYAHTKHNAVFGSLKGVQFYADGDAFTGGRPADPEDFDDLSMEEDEDPLA